MEINTNVSLSPTETQIFKKFKNLSVNETPKSQGEGTIRISPFDDYFLFTIFDEIDGENKPIDLSNAGRLYLTFADDKDEIRIPNYTNVQDIDMSSGQVLFRISKDESKKILALSNRNFYVSSVFIDGLGQSDESIIYTGNFLKINESAKVSLDKQIQDTQLLYTKEVSSLQADINKLNSDIRDRDTLIAEQEVLIRSLKETIQGLTDQVSEFNKKLPSAVASQLIEDSKNIQKTEEILKLDRQQIQANKEMKKAVQTKATAKSFFKQAADQLSTNVLTNNPIE